MESKQFAWLYLVEYGWPNASSSYYGGFQLSNDKGCCDYSALTREKKNVLANIKQVGVNWERTNAPDTESTDYFQGTFCDSGTKEVLYGIMTLNNGIDVPWYGDAIDVKNVFDMMAEADTYKEKFKEIFGE